MWYILALFVLLSKIADSENVTIKMKAYGGYASVCNTTNDCKSASLKCDDNVKRCLCADDYEFDNFDGMCVSYPVIGEQCDDNCYPSHNIRCINGYCEICYESSGVEKCSNHMQNQHLLLTATQIAMTGALIVGILIILILFWKLCSKSTYRRPASRRRAASGTRGRISTISNESASSLQRAVTERLRNAPPPYSRASLALPPPGDTPPPYNLRPDNGYVNASFVLECNIPPPAYSSIDSQMEEIENEQQKISTVDTDIEPKENETAPASTVLHM